MAEPEQEPPHRLRHAPGLDGLRGLAVLAVVVFHAGAPTWLPGGFLGVSLFFTLSGYLIASLVLAEVERTGGLDLGRFWVRRFRRLLPALLVMLAAVVVLARTIDVPTRTRGELVGGLTYTSNWVQLASGSSYAELFQAPSPLTHLWSLAIEEQFYVVFPLVVLGSVWLLARRGAGVRAFPWVLAGFALAVVVLGEVWALRVDDSSATYYATPARLPEIAAGILLAVALRHRHGAHRGWWSAALGLVALAVFALAVRETVVTDGWVTDGGLAAFALVSVVLVAVAAGPGPFGRALGIRPLAALGVISYGLYLVHWPVVVVLSRPRVDFDPVPLFVVRVAVSLGLAIGCYLLVERPVRRGAPATGASWPVGRQLGVGAGALAVGVVVVLLAVPAPQPQPPLAERAPAVAAHPSTTAKGSSAATTAPAGPPQLLLLGDSVPAWLVRDGAGALDPDEVRLVDGTSEGCDGAEGAPVGRAGTGVVVTVPASCTGWRSQYPAVLAGGRVDVAALVIGSGAVLDRKLGDAFVGPCDDAARHWYGADVRARIDWLAERAERVVVVLPAWAEDWSGWVNPPDHRDRTDCVRANLRAQAEAAAAAGEPVSVVDLADELCPDGRDRCRPYRQTDGVHVDPDHAPAVLAWLVGRALAAEPGGGDATPGN